MAKRTVRYLIIGAGPTGLGAGYRLQELGERDFILVDAADRVGGLSRSYQDSAGFTWDLGGHIQFSHYRYFDELMDLALGKDGWYFHQRESWVWMRDRFIPYPFQNNIRHLPESEVLECVKGLVDLYRNQSTQTPRNFLDWIHATFGAGIARVFMEPYNFKVWAYPLQEMSSQWIGERVAVTDLQRVFENILLKKDDLSWGPNHQFRFPKSGGTGAVWEAVADRVGRDQILLNKSVHKIAALDRVAYLDDGTEISYESILSTIPLDQLTQICSGVSEKTQVASSRLRHSSSNIIGIGLQGQPSSALDKKCWMYFPEDNCPFYRVTVFSHYSPANVPDPRTQWSLMAEVAESPAKPVNQETLVDQVIEGMRATKLISSSDKIISRWKYRCDYGYPTPSIDRDSILQEVQPELESLRLFSRGRFGGWKYEVSNQDHSLMQGVEWANKVHLGVPETTYFYPTTANSGWGNR